MMKASELRIGNYLQDLKGRLCKVECIDIGRGESYQISAPAIKGALTSMPLSPIPIAEEWLVRFGFDSDFEIEDIIITSDNEKAIDLSWNKELKCASIWVSNTEKCFEIPLNKIKFVHQLQNIFYIFTGQELKIQNL